MKFVYSDDPQKNQLVQKDLDFVINLVLFRLKSIKSIMIIGGFARGEGAVVYYNDQLLPVNDYDLYLFSEKEVDQQSMEQVFNECNQVLRDSRKPLKKPKTNVVSFFDFQKDFFVDGHFLNIQDLPSLPPIIRYWEMKKNGLILYGSDVRKLIKNFSQDEIPLSEGFRFLNNYLTTLIMMYSTDQKEPFWYFINRIWAGFAVSLLLLKRRLEPTYLLRANKLLNIYEKEFPDLYQKIPDLAKQAQKSTFIKLDPPSKIDLSDEELYQFWQRTRNVGLKLLDFYRKNWIGADDLSARYFQPYIEDSLPYGKKLFSIYNLLSQLFLNLKYCWQIWKKEKKLFIPKNPFVSTDIKLWQLMPEVLLNLEDLESAKTRQIFSQIPYFNAENLDLQKKYLLAFHNSEKTRDVHRELGALRKIFRRIGSIFG